MYDFLMFENRTCKGACGKTLPKTEKFFYFRKSSKNGKSYPSSYCLVCERAKAALNRKTKWNDSKGKEIIRAQNKIFRSKLERIEIDKKRGHDYYVAHADDIKARVKIYRKDPVNKARRNALWRKLYALERDTRRSAFKERYHSDPEFRLRGSIRSRVWEALRKAGGTKNSSILNALPYSLEELKWHIESQFDDGMDWDKPGSFSIDHIIPQSMFKYSSLNDPEFRLCWSLDNLRPLVPSQNFSDGDRSHLFSGCKSFTDLTTWIRSNNFGSEPEKLQDILASLSLAQIKNGKLPLTQVGLGLLDHLFPNRFDAKTIGKKSLNDAYADDQAFLKVVTYIIRTGRAVTPRLFYRNMAFSCRAPSHFFPSAAAALVKKYAPRGRILDPFLGWGGRTLGALCVDVTSIDGCDLQEASVNGCQKLATMFPNCMSRFTKTDFRNIDFSGPYDLLLTSPPFANLESYGIGEVPISRWKTDTMDHLANLANRVISSNGSVIIHCGNRSGFCMSEIVTNSMNEHGFTLFETLSYKSKQPILVFQR